MADAIPSVTVSPPVYSADGMDRWLGEEQLFRTAIEHTPDYAFILFDPENRRLQGAMDGVEAARRIRSQADIPIIYVTAHASVLASSENGDRCTCLAKPFSPSQLQAAVQAVLGRTEHPVH
jgi:CheY-like chemotaxis protein